MRAEQRRRQLLDVAARVFARHGYRGTTTAELASAAGITEPILYRHFQNKLDLFVSLIHDVGGRMLDSLRAEVSRSATAADEVDALVTALLADASPNHNDSRLIIQAINQQESEAAIRGAVRRHVAAMHRMIHAELSSLQKRRAIRDDVPPASMAWFLVDLALGARLLAALKGGKGQRAAASRHQVALLARSLASN
jgi:AcrR family transcriptional regulator